MRVVVCDTGPLSAEEAEQAERWRRIGGLGAGEAEAIALASLRQTDWLITDDAGARLAASLLGLEVHGSLGIVLWAAAARHLGRDAGFAALDALFKSSLWMSPRIREEARQALERLFP